MRHNDLAWDMPGPEVADWTDPDPSPYPPRGRICCPSHGGTVKATSGCSRCRRPHAANFRHASRTLPRRLPLVEHRPIEAAVAKRTRPIMAALGAPPKPMPWEDADSIGAKTAAIRTWRDGLLQPACAKAMPSGTLTIRSVVPAQWDCARLTPTRKEPT